jgi:hypothetical protein
VEGSQTIRSANFSSLSQLISHAKSRVPRPSPWPDGRRKCGTVSGSVLAVLTRADSEMRMKNIHAEVERELGGSVSFQSVADYLIKNSKGSRPLFVRTRHGHYRLLSGAEPNEHRP